MDDKTVKIEPGARKLLGGLTEEEVKQAICKAEHVQIVNDFRRIVRSRTETGKDIVVECHVNGREWNVVYAYQR